MGLVFFGIGDVWIGPRKWQRGNRDGRKRDS